MLPDGLNGTMSSSVVRLRQMFAQDELCRWEVSQLIMLRICLTLLAVKMCSTCFNAYTTIIVKLLNLYTCMHARKTYQHAWTSKNIHLPVGILPGLQL